MKNVRWLGLLIWLIGLLPMSGAQSGTTIYYWETGDLAFRYPASWDTPRALQRFGQETLWLAEEVADDPENRSPEIPFITLVLIPLESEEPDLYDYLDEFLREVELIPVGPLPSLLLNVEAVATSGQSSDGAFYGEGRIAIVPEGDILLVYGRGTTDQRDRFATLFNTIVSSMVSGTDLPPETIEHGVLWHTERFPEDGENAFTDIEGIALAPNGSLFIVDSFVGIIQLDTSSGAVLEITRLPEETQASDIAIAGDGSIYVSDVFCQCIHVLQNTIWQDDIEGFGEAAPLHLAIASDDTLFATDMNETGSYIRLLRGTEDTALFFEEQLFEQPVIASDIAGNLLVLTSEGTIYTQEGVGFTPLSNLETGSLSANAMSLDANGNLLITTQDEGILIVNAEGQEINRIGRIVPSFPLPGDLVSPSGIAIDDAGTIYWADSDGSFGNVTAMSPRVEAGRTGATHLVPGVVVRGALSELSPQQAWTFDGVAGQEVTLVGASLETDLEGLDMALRLTSPDEREIAFNDNHESDERENPSDALISDVVLPIDGTYIVLAEHVSGTGSYQLGFSQSQFFDLSSGTIEIDGTISELFPAQRWIFEGQVGQVITLSMLTESGSIDPVLRLLNQRGELIAENDDADDPALGRDSQIVQIRLPSTGSYTIEATRFDGEGRYRLIVVVTS